MAMGLCKCRQCGEVTPSKAWSAAKEPACPQCGHTRFSISFVARPAPPTAQPQAVDGAVDAYGRRRKSIRLEHLTGAAPPAAKPGFHERMQGMRGRADKPEPSDE